VLDEDRAIPIPRRALEVGIDFFDMADWYSAGANEMVVRRALLSMAPRGPLPDMRHDQRLRRGAQAARACRGRVKSRAASDRRSAQAQDEARLLRLDEAWNEAYRRNDRAPLAEILADDFTGLTPSGEAITKAALMINPPGGARSVVFSEQWVRVFGDTGISRGRLHLELADRRIDQRFLRVFARRDGVWRAVSVSVTPLAAEGDG